jgi:hypothetical protein
LDEIDQLESKNQGVLYTMFEWPSLPSSRLILIGTSSIIKYDLQILGFSSHQACSHGVKTGRPKRGRDKKKHGA